MSDQAQASPAPSPEITTPASIQLSQLHMMTTNIWQANHFLGGTIDFASYAVIEQLMVEYEATIKNMCLFAVSGNQKGYEACKVQLETTIKDRQNLILNISSTILAKNLKEAEEAKASVNGGIDNASS